MTSHKKGHRKAGTKCLASAFELAKEEERATTIPPSTTPAMLQQPVQSVQPVLEAITTTEIGLQLVDLTGNSLTSDTQPSRTYQQAVEEEAEEEVGQFDIDPETEGLLDRIFEEVEA